MQDDERCGKNVYINELAKKNVEEDGKIYVQKKGLGK